MAVQPQRVGIDKFICNTLVAGLTVYTQKVCNNEMPKGHELDALARCGLQPDVNYARDMVELNESRFNRFWRNTQLRPRDEDCAIPPVAVSTLANHVQYASTLLKVLDLDLSSSLLIYGERHRHWRPAAYEGIVAIFGVEASLSIAVMNHGAWMVYPDTEETRHSALRLYILATKRAADPPKWTDDEFWPFVEEEGSWRNFGDPYRVMSFLLLRAVHVSKGSRLLAQGDYLQGASERFIATTEFLYENAGAILREATRGALHDSSVSEILLQKRLHYRETGFDIVTKIESLSDEVIRSLQTPTKGQIRIVFYPEGLVLVDNQHYLNLPLGLDFAPQAEVYKKRTEVGKDVSTAAAETFLKLRPTEQDKRNREPFNDAALTCYKMAVFIIRQLPKDILTIKWDAKNASTQELLQYEI